jgi:phosphomannomutase
VSQENNLIISVSGIRGIFGRSLTADIAARFARAFGAYTNGGKTVLSMDGRPSGLILREAVRDGLLSSGCTVEELGVAPTPTCGFAIRRLHAAGGIQITASHNPAEWNGLKLFSKDGRVLGASDGRRVTEMFEKHHYSLAPHEKRATSGEYHPSNDWHRETILRLIDAQAIRAARYKVFLDANGGAGGRAGRELLQALGCETICQGCAADGVFLHEPEPIADNLCEVCPRVSGHGAQIGLVLDPDADRLALIDERGRYIGEELTLALAILFCLGGQRGPVVANMSTSRVCEVIARRAGCPFYRAAVGEANVVDKMLEVGAVIGGEGNGGVIDPRVGHVRDSFIAIGLILNLMADTGKKISELVAELPRYCIVKEKYAIDRARVAESVSKIAEYGAGATVNRLDGLRLDWPDRWVHVRPSNTEPVVRVIAEAPDEEQARRLCRDIRDVMTNA